MDCALSRIIIFLLNCVNHIFDWTPVPDHGAEPQPLLDIRLWHTHINLDSAGHSTSRTSYISAPASPSKRAEPSFDGTYNSYNWNPEPPPPKINIENYTFSDPTYQHYLDLMEPGPPLQRKRTMEVTFCVPPPHTHWLTAT
jgi:hypothetical protein